MHATSSQTLSCLPPSYDAQYQRFSFGYRLVSETTDGQHIDHQFVEQIDMSAITQPQRDNINPTIIDTICAHLSIALGISYYKLAPTPSISIPFTLTATQQAFWQQFYLQ